jgi:C4-dicarboxylate transporter, DctM subunit
VVDLFTAALVTCMSQKRCESLPPDLRQVIDDLSGAWGAEFTGTVWDQNENLGIEAAKKAGATIYTVPREERQRWAAKLTALEDEWVVSMEAKRLPGRQLLGAGVVPGIIVGVFLILAILMWVKVSPSHAPETPVVPASERWASLRRIWPSLLLIVLVVVLLYAGVATPAEVGALEALQQTVKTSAIIFMILIGATIFGYYMALSQIPQHVVGVITDLNLNRWVVISGIVVAYFVVSMFMDELPLLLLTLQLTFPLLISLGFDPVWFGVLSMLMVSMGLVFPPVGMIAFVVSANANVSLVKVYKGTSILMIALVLTTVLIMVFPQIVLWLPSTMQ